MISFERKMLQVNLVQFFTLPPSGGSLHLSRSHIMTLTSYASVVWCGMLTHCDVRLACVCEFHRMTRFWATTSQQVANLHFYKVNFCTSWRKQLGKATKQPSNQPSNKVSTRAINQSSCQPSASNKISRPLDDRILENKIWMQTFAKNRSNSENKKSIYKMTLKWLRTATQSSQQDVPKTWWKTFENRNLLETVRYRLHLNVWTKTALRKKKVMWIN